MRAACLYGGAPKGPQLAELRQRPGGGRFESKAAPIFSTHRPKLGDLKRKRPQLLVATPGRLNDLLEPPAGPCGEAPVKVKKFEENIVG